MQRTLYIIFALLMACSGRNNGFGELPDAGRDGGGADTGDAQPDVPQVARIGEICSAPDDCESAALCVGSVAGEFMCMRRCDQSYELCDDGSVCLPVMTDEASICYIGGSTPQAESCRNNLDCADGLLCFGASDQFYCRPACEDAMSCRSGETCERLDSGAGLCRASVGAACLSSADCEPGLSCSDEIADGAGRFPGGYCTNVCQEDADCPATAVCARLPGAAQSLCVQVCEHRSECRFNDAYDCANASICNLSTEPDACQSMFGDESLCVPGPF